MKLRLEENTLRLRLSEAEVREFARVGELAHSLIFAPGQTLRYVLRRLPPADPAPALRVSYVAGELVVELPAAQARHWAATDTVGLSATVEIAGNQPVRVVVEKDLDRQH